MSLALIQPRWLLPRMTLGAPSTIWSPAAAAGPSPPLEARDRTHGRDVERAHREVEPRALGLGHDAAARRAADGPLLGLELADDHSEQRRLPAAVGPEHRDALARTSAEGDALEHRPGAVAGREATGADELVVGHSPEIAHPCRPPVKPRNMASALARSMLR